MDKGQLVINRARELAARGAAGASQQQQQRQLLKLDPRSGEHRDRYQTAATAAPTASTAVDVDMAVGAYFAGIGIALCTTFMSALGMTLQKITHRRIEAAKLRARARQQQAQEMRELHLGDRGGGGVGGAGSAEARGGRTRRARRGADGDEADSDNTKQLRTWKQPLWLSGIGLMLASSLLSLAVFALVGQAVASCFAAVTLIWNAIFGYLVLREVRARCDASDADAVMAAASVDDGLSPTCR